jgi:hypothetical protein
MYPAKPLPGGMRRGIEKREAQRLVVRDDCVTWHCGGVVLQRLKALVESLLLEIGGTELTAGKVLARRDKGAVARRCGDSDTA